MLCGLPFQSAWASGGNAIHQSGMSSRRTIQTAAATPSTIQTATDTDSGRTLVGA